MQKQNETDTVSIDQSKWAFINDSNTGEIQLYSQQDPNTSICTTEVPPRLGHKRTSARHVTIYHILTTLPFLNLVGISVGTSLKTIFKFAAQSDF